MAPTSWATAVISLYCTTQLISMPPGFVGMSYGVVSTKTAAERQAEGLENALQVGSISVCRTRVSQSSPAL